jgi:anti-anti-sigma factor
MSRYPFAMPIHAFRIETVRPGYTYQALLRCAGPLVSGDGAEPEVWSALLDSPDRVDVLLDLTGVTDIDAAGVGILAELCQVMHRQGGTVRLLAANERVRTMLRVTGVEDALDLPTPPARVFPFRSRTMQPSLIWSREPARAAV